MRDDVGEPGHFRACRRRFRRDPSCVAEARRWTEDALVDAPALAERAALLVSELATNALRHGRSGFELAVGLDAKRARVEVGDEGDARPELRQPGADELGGRGLIIVDSLADAWGVERRLKGKVVWFELLVPPTE